MAEKRTIGHLKALRHQRYLNRGNLSAGRMDAWLDSELNCSSSTTKHVVVRQFISFSFEFWLANLPTHSYSQLFGRVIKAEYLSLGTLITAGAVAYASIGGKKAEPAPSGATVRETIQKVKESIPLNAGSRCVVWVGFMDIPHSDVRNSFVSSARKSSCMSIFFCNHLMDV